MRKIIILLLPVFLVFHSHSQTGRIVSVFLEAQYTQTLSDRTPGNNPWALGVGLQGFLNLPSKFKPTLEVTADGYPVDDKVLRLTPDGQPIDDIGGVVNLFAGASYQLSRQVYLSLLAGPSFINGSTLAGIKPSLGVYLSARQRWVLKVSYIHIFNREPISQMDFGSASVGIGLRLF